MVSVVLKIAPPTWLPPMAGSRMGGGCFQGGHDVLAMIPEVVVVKESNAVVGAVLEDLFLNVH